MAYKARDDQWDLEVLQQIQLIQLHTWHTNDSNAWIGCTNTGSKKVQMENRGEAACRASLDDKLFRSGKPVGEHCIDHPVNVAAKSKMHLEYEKMISRIT